jgi:hypothetical protein
MLGFPAFPDVPLVDLFQAMENVQAHLDTLDTSHLSSDKLEAFQEIKSLLRENADTVRKELPGELDRLREQYSGLLAEVAAEKDKFDQEIARARQLAQDLPAIRDKAASDAEKARQQAEKDVQDQIAKLLAPLQKGPQELPLAEGEVLKKDILNLQSTAGLGSGPRPGSRVSGNIWENWKKPGQ